MSRHQAGKPPQPVKWPRKRVRCGWLYALAGTFRRDPYRLVVGDSGLPPYERMVARNENAGLVRMLAKGGQIYGQKRIGRPGRPPQEDPQVRRTPRLLMRENEGVARLRHGASAEESGSQCGFCPIALDLRDLLFGEAFIQKNGAWIDRSR